MHGYSTDSGERRIVPLLLASVAITLAWLSSKILAVMHLTLPWWLDASLQDVEQAAWVVLLTRIDIF